MAKKLSYVEKLYTVRAAKALLVHCATAGWYRGICSCMLSSCSSIVFSIDSTEFPELYTFKPEDALVRGYWWPRGADHLQTRLDVLESLEKMYESKITFWDRLSYQIKKTLPWN